MSEDEVREEFSTFLEQHPDGKIHKREFKEMLEKVGNLVVWLILAFWCSNVGDSSSSISAQTLPGQDATCMQKHIFRCYDENENGYIDFVEFMVALQLAQQKHDFHIFYLAGPSS